MIVPCGHEAPSPIISSVFKLTHQGFTISKVSFLSSQSWYMKLL